MRRYIIILVLLVSVLSVSSSAAGTSTLKSAQFANDTTLEVFGKKIDTEVVSAEIEGVEGYRHYVPARDLAEYLGYQVTWDDDNKVISVGLPKQNGEQIDPKKLEQYKLDADKMKESLLSKFSTRELDSLRKEMAYVQQIFGNDPLVFSLLFAEDYKTYKSGGDSQFDYIWKDLDK